MTDQPIASLAGAAEETRVLEHGWQSWSPSLVYRLGASPARPTDENRRVMCYRSTTTAPPDRYVGEGLLVVELAPGGPTHVFAAADPTVAVPTITARPVGGRLDVTADGEVTHTAYDVDLGEALRRWADDTARAGGVPPLRPAPTVWSSWYQYYADVQQRDIQENLDAMDDLGLDVEVVQVDDGWQAEIGDWTTTSPRFGDLGELVARIRDRGRRAGVWLAPLLVGSASVTSRAHPDWLVRDGYAGSHWGQQLAVLDVTHPDAAAYLTTALRRLLETGIDYFKVDFLYAGALPGGRYGDADSITAYREALALIRDAIGPDPYLLGCGAPILPSIGLVDAMRVGPDVATHYQPADGDLSQPAQRSAVLTSETRRYQHGRFWVNDPDCLLARPGIERREEWAAFVAGYPGQRAASDRLRDLDAWGLETTRRLLVRTPTDPGDRP